MQGSQRSVFTQTGPKAGTMDVWCISNKRELSNTVPIDKARKMQMWQCQANEAAIRSFY